MSHKLSARHEPLKIVKLSPDGGQSTDYMTLKIFKDVNELNANLPKESTLSCDWMVKEGLVEEDDGRCEACFIQPENEPNANNGECMGEILVAVGVETGVIVHEATHAGLFYGGLCHEWNRNKGAFGEPPDECKAYEHWQEACAVMVQNIFEQIAAALALLRD